MCLFASMANAVWAAFSSSQACLDVLRQDQKRREKSRKYLILLMVPIIGVDNKNNRLFLLTKK